MPKINAPKSLYLAVVAVLTILIFKTVQRSTLTPVMNSSRKASLEL